MKKVNIVKRVGALSAGLAVGALVFAGPAMAAADASSYAASVSIFGISTGPIIPSTPGSSPNTLASLNLGNALTGGVKFGVLTSDATADTNAGTSSADGGLESASLTAPLSAFGFSLNSLSAHCAIDANGNVTMSSQFAGGTISGPFGIPTINIPLNPPPNTVIGIPGILSVTLNEQTVVNGVATVNAFDFSALGSAVGSLIIGHATCGPNAPVQGGAVANPAVIGGILMSLVIVFVGYRAVRSRRPQLAGV